MEIKVNKTTIEGEKAKKIFTALKQTIEAITEEDSEKETEVPESNKQPYDKENLVADIDVLCDKMATVLAQFYKIAISDGTQLSYYLSNTFNEKGIEFCKELNAVKSYLNEYNLRKSPEQ